MMRRRFSEMPTRRVTLLLLVLAATLPARTAPACDSTACAIAARSADGAVHAGQWRLEVSGRYIDQSRRLAGTKGTSDVLRPRVDLATGAFDTGSHSELNSSMSAVQIEVGYGLRAGTSVYAALPVYHEAAVEHIHFAAFTPTGDLDPEHGGHGEPGAGTPFALRSTAHGLGDLRLGAVQRLFSGPSDEVSAGLTVKLATGSTRRAASDGVIDPMLQPGTGATDVAGSLQYVRRLSASTLAITGSFQKTTQSADRYQYGDEGLVAVAASHPLGERLTGTLQLKLQKVGRHRFNDAPVPSTGGTFVQLAPGLRFRMSPTWSTYGSIQIPAYAQVNESQLAPRVTMTVGVVKSF
jgi:hypothetical protein